MASGTLLAQRRSSSTFRNIDLVAKCLALLAIAIGSSITTGFLRLADSPFLAFAFVGVLLLHLWSRPGILECAVTALVGLLLGTVYKAAHFPPGEYWGDSVVGPAAFVGHASLLVLLGRALWSEDEERRQSFLRVLLPGAALVAFMMVTGIFLTLFRSFDHPSYDAFLYEFDNTLGFQASFVLGKIVAKAFPLWCVTFIVYEGLPLAVAFLYAAQSDSEIRPAANTLTLFMAVGLAGFVLYRIYPASGPIYAFTGAFPWRAPSVTPLPLKPMLLASPPNAMPSLHFTWALLLWWNSRHLRWWVQAITGAFLLVTVLATLGSGEHYLIDLIVAVPFSLSMQAVCSSAIPWRSAARVWPVLIGAAMVGAWLAMLRFGVSYFQHWHALSWALVLATVALSATAAFELRKQSLAALGASQGEAPQVALAAGRLA